MYICDLSEEVYDRSVRTRSVGWLGNEILTRGHTEPEIVAYIQLMKKYSPNLNGFYMGYHVCEICGKHQDNGSFSIHGSETTYILPFMIDHYIVEHQYKLPCDVEETIRVMGVHAGVNL